MRTRRMAAALAACAVVLAACGGDDDEAAETAATSDASTDAEETDEAETAPTSEASTDAEETDEAETSGTATEGVAEGGPCDGVIDAPVTLELSVHGGNTNYGEIVDRFNNGPGAELGITVEVLDLGEEAYETAITAAAAADDLPDIMDLDGPFLYNFAWSGFVEPFGNCVQDGKLDDFVSSTIQQGTYEGELYALASWEGGLGLWGSRSALDAVGARLPSGPEDAWTVDEFEQIMADLVAQGHPYALDIKWWYGAGEWRPFGFAPMIQSAGGDVIDRSTMMSADGALNGDAAVEVMERFQGWVETGYVDLEAVDDSNFTVGADGEAVTGDEVPLSWVGHWMYNSYSEALGDDLVLLPLPDFGTGSKSGSGSWQWAMSPAGAEKDADAVWAFIDFVTSPEMVEAIAEIEGAMPNLSSLLDADPRLQPGGDLYVYRLNFEGAPNIAVPRPATPAYPTIRQAFSDAFADIVTGADVASTLDRAVEVIDDDIDINDGYPAPGS